MAPPPAAGAAGEEAAAGSPQHAAAAQQQQQPPPGGGAHPRAPGQQLQRGHSVWLSPERFEAADFSPDQCVAELRRYVPLPTVKAELQSHLLHLKNKLVEALNEDYGEYVGLAGRLTGLEGGVVRMRQPLLDIHAKLTGAQEALQAELNALQQGLQRRQDAAAARATLELMQEVAASTSKVEKLLAEVAAGAAAPGGAAGPASGGGAAPVAADGAASDGGAADGDGELDARCRLLERVAGETARLVFLAERGKHLAFVQSLERRIDGARFGLNRQLQAALAAALGAGAWGPAAHCLRGFLELGEAGQAEDGLRSALVGPLVRQVVTDVRQQQLQGGAGAGGAGLSTVVTQTLARLREAAGPLLAQLSAPGSGLAGLDLLGAVLLAEISQAVADGMPGVFSPGNPTAFQANYLAGQALLEQLEALAPSRAAVERLRASAAAAGWAKRWNLPVYFSLIYQDVAGTFEAVATASQLQPAAEAKLTAPLPPLAPELLQQDATAAPPALRLATSACLWGCLQRALAPSVFLLQLGDKFARLIAQLLARYDTWLQDVAAQRSQAAAAGPQPVPPGGAVPGAPASAAAGAAAAAAAAGGAGAAGGEAKSGPAAWAGSMPAESCAAVCADADLMQALLQGPLTEQLARQFGGLPPDAVAQLTAMVAAQAARIAQHGQQVLLLLAADVLESCVGCVRQLKGITATYRMTAKGPPVRHSHYVAGVLQPLRTLLDSAPVAALAPRLRALLARDVIDGLNARYTALAEELLTSVKKTESSLKRLKKTRPGEAAGDDAAGGVSDSDKICLQLFLDVQEHGRQIARFGFAAEELHSFTQLLATVTPAPAQGASQPPQPAAAQAAGA